MTKKISPRLDTLKGQLLASSLHRTNPILYQVIDQLIDATRQGVDELNLKVTTLSKLISTGVVPVVSYVDMYTGAIPSELMTDGAGSTLLIGFTA